MNWYIGQKIVCINKHSANAVKVGDEFTIRDIKPSWCNCSKQLLDIGKGGSFLSKTHCSTCNILDHELTSVHWFSDWLFAPIEEIPESHSEAIKELLKEPQLI